MSPARPATPADAAQVLRVHRASRSAAYAGLGTPQEAAGRSTVESWRETLEGAAAAWVWEQDGSAVAFAVVAGARLAGLYVLPGHEGRGIGSALLDLAVAAGARTLWVYAEHAPARAFYEQRGWVAEPGTAHVDDRWALKRPALRYRREA